MLLSKKVMLNASQHLYLPLCHFMHLSLLSLYECCNDSSSYEDNIK